MKLKNPVWLTSDRKTAVPAGHADAAFLLAGAGAIVSPDISKQYGLSEFGAKDQGKEKAEPLFPAGVTSSTPDGVNTSQDAPQAKGLVARAGAEMDDYEPKPRVASVTIKPAPKAEDAKPSAVGLAPAKKRG